MRCIIVLFSIILLSACGNKLERLEQATEKVTKTVNACTEAVTGICNEGGSISVSKEKVEKTGADTKATSSWDTRMLLW